MGTGCGDIDNSVRPAVDIGTLLRENILNRVHLLLSVISIEMILILARMDLILKLQYTILVKSSS